MNCVAPSEALENLRIFLLLLRHIYIEPQRLTSIALAIRKLLSVKDRTRKSSARGIASACAAPEIPVRKIF
jgi:hypothetical protein